MSFVEVMAEDELWVGDMRAVLVGRRRLLLLRTDHGLHAYEDRCPHLGVPLSRGTLAQGTLTCSAHHHQFDACTGRGKNPANAQLTVFAVACRHGKIIVGVEPGAPTVAP